MAVVFEGQVKIMLNRHGLMGDGIVLHFPDNVVIFINTSDKYTCQVNDRKNEKGQIMATILGFSYETVTDAYIAAQVHLGKLELKDGMYVPKEQKS